MTSDLAVKVVSTSYRTGQHDVQINGSTIWSGDLATAIDKASKYAKYASAHALFADEALAILANVDLDDEADTRYACWAIRMWAADLGILD